MRGDTRGVRAEGRSFTCSTSDFTEAMTDVKDLEGPAEMKRWWVTRKWKDKVAKKNTPWRA